MFDFIVPEPGRLYQYFLNQPNLPSVEKPIPPQAYGLHEASNIDISNYLMWSSLYGATVRPPPPLYEYTSGVFKQPRSTSERYQQFFDASVLELPAGYGAFWGSAGNLRTGHEEDVDHEILLQLGPLMFRKEAPVWGGYLNGETKIPVLVQGHNVWGYSVYASVMSKRTEQEFTKWQIETYDAIIQGYNNLKSRYEEQLAAANIRRGISIQGRNPEMNREIEKVELKRLCISMLRKSHFDEFGAIVLTSPQGYPEMDFNIAESQGSIIQFFEQAFEWEQIVYLFYPYFWGNKGRWMEVLSIQETDPLFAKFLKSGSARVLIPVRPNYEDAMLYYLETGNIWAGGDRPHINDPLYVSIIEEIREEQGTEPEGEEIDKWEVEVPTSLVYLKENGDLPEWRD